MKKIATFLFFLFFTFNNLYAVETPENIDEIFAEWLVEFKKVAKEKHGIRDEILESAFKNIEYNHKVISLDRKQPEFVKTFYDYYDSKITKNTIEQGKKKLKEHEKILKEVQKNITFSRKFSLLFGVRKLITEGTKENHKLYQI